MLFLIILCALLPTRASRHSPSWRSSRTESGSDFNFNIPRSSHPPGHPARTALALGLARQQHPVNNLAAPELPPLRLEAASLQGRVQSLLKSEVYTAWVTYNQDPLNERGRRA